MMLESLDCETTGVDLYHGNSPYFVSFCDEEFNNTFYEWDVEPLTRKVKVIKSDVEEIAQRILDADELVIQNPKFDVAALLPILPEDFKWPWEKTKDTLLAGHLLASNHAKDLTSLGIEYCAIDISGYEALVEEATKAARDIARSTEFIAKRGTWRIAEAGLEEMPSAKEKVWKYDMWLPRAMARLKVPGWQKHWHTVLQDYGNADTATCLGVYKAQLELLEHRGLLRIYEERLKLLPIIHAMERNGITINRERLEKLDAQYREESAKSNRICCNIAKTYDDYDLKLPKSGNNKSLTTFIFEKMKLPVVGYTDKNNPSLDKIALEQYQATLPAKSRELTFVQNLRAKRKRDTAISYMEGYQKYWLPLEDHSDYFVLHPSLNPTGTATLRFSSSQPNEQNISKQGMFEGDSATLRYLFGPRPGREWWSLDAKNIELRIPAYESGERELIDLFEKPDEPPYYGSTHLLNFHTVYEDLWDAAMIEVGLIKVGPFCKKKYASTWYQWCKNGGFAVQRCAVEREEGTADRAFHKPGSHSRLKARFSRLETLNQHWIKYAEKHGYVETMVDKSLGVKRGYPLLCTRNERGYILPTVPLNYHVQGTAMQWMCKAMVRCQDQLDAWNKMVDSSGYHIAMQVHDELVFDFPYLPNRGNLRKIKQIQKLMEKGGEDIGVPTPVGIEYHENNWSEGVTIE